MYVVDQTNGLNVLVYNEEPLSLIIKESNEEDDFGFSDNQDEVFLEIVGAKNIFKFQKNKIIDDDKSYNINLLNLKLFNFSREFTYSNIVDGVLSIDSEIDFIELQIIKNLRWIFYRY